VAQERSTQIEFSLHSQFGGPFYLLREKLAKDTLLREILRPDGDRLCTASAMAAARQGQTQKEDEREQPEARVKESHSKLGWGKGHILEAAE